MWGADTPLCIPPGAGLALLPQAHRLRAAHLPLGQSHPHGAAGIGAPAPSPCHHQLGGTEGPPPSPAPSVPCWAWDRCPESRRECGRTAAGGEPLLPHPALPAPSAGGVGLLTPALIPPGAEAIADLTACALERGQPGPAWGTPGAPSSPPGEPRPPALGRPPKRSHCPHMGQGWGCGTPPIAA